MNINWVPKKGINNLVVTEHLNESLKTNHFANNGPNVKFLENELYDLLKIDESKSIIVVSNGSVAIQVLTAAIEYDNNISIQWGTQSFTFPPSCQGSLRGAKIFDIDENGALDLDTLDPSINGIIVTNIFGNVSDINKYKKWQLDKENRFLIFDNAATPYTYYDGKNSCNYGNGSIISFHHTKPIGFGEGGAIIVDKKYENTIRCLCNFGINLSSDYFVRNGNNYKMSEVSAIYIIQYLTNFRNISEKHKQMYKYMKKCIANIPCMKMFPSFHDDDSILVSCFCILHDSKEESVRILEILQENNIFCRKYYYPLSPTKNASDIYDRIICIPCTVDITFENIDYIIRLLQK